MRGAASGKCLRRIHPLWVIKVKTRFLVLCCIVHLLFVSTRVG
jgi:hypothetical protein